MVASPWYQPRASGAGKRSNVYSDVSQWQCTAYADPDSDETHDVPVATITGKFYAWLAEFPSRGQVIVLANERISAETAEKRKPIQFTKKPGIGRSDFYPHRVGVSTHSLYK